MLTSSLKRTQETAVLYNFNRYKADTLLDKLDFGKYEGQSKEGLKKEIGAAWQEGPRELVLGEAVSSLQNRITSFNFKN